MREAERAREGGAEVGVVEAIGLCGFVEVDGAVVVFGRRALDCFDGTRVPSSDPAPWTEHEADVTVSHSRSNLGLTDSDRIVHVLSDVDCVLSYCVSWILGHLITTQQTLA